ncbi:hypothetical protein SAMN06265795_12253 [Noviherbaspirillum humi]|uniref:Uncharacterized protein n=1 Tax=Noviherbaspirillum humi TaxID=1688639 RepID=A0A239LFQ8_9BURK|nr:hypothetical protein [Noviherbaspirillum humi]SNT29130.1 hypothetical protein SAMN06265795_12253 [Noviherbaspirillum humi]
MKHYINAAGGLFAFEDDGSQDEFITDDMRLATEAEIAAIQNPTSAYADVFVGAMNVVRIKREEILNRLAGIGFAALAEGDAATAQAIVATRQSLLDITKNAGILAATDESSLRDAILAAYGAIVAATPANVQTAFRGVDL